MELRVVPHPKLKRDYTGRRVRTKVEMSNGLMSIPAGTLATVLIQSPKGSSLQADACQCCGVSIRISAVPADEIEFVEAVE